MSKSTLHKLESAVRHANGVYNANRGSYPPPSIPSKPALKSYIDNSLGSADETNWVRLYNALTALELGLTVNPEKPKARRL